MSDMQARIKHVLLEMSHQELRERYNHFSMYMAAYPTKPSGPISEKDEILAEFKDCDFMTEILPALRSEMSFRHMEGRPVRYMGCGDKFHTPEGCFAVNYIGGGTKSSEATMTYNRYDHGGLNLPEGEQLHWYWYDAQEEEHETTFYL